MTLLWEIIYFFLNHTFQLILWIHTLIAIFHNKMDTIKKNSRLSYRTYCLYDRTTLAKKFIFYFIFYYPVANQISRNFGGSRLPLVKSQYLDKSVE